MIISIINQSANYFLEQSIIWRMKCDKTEKDMQFIITRKAANLLFLEN